MAYKITLKDGTELSGLALNGTNYVSEIEIDESIFTDENLSEMIVSDGEMEETLTDMVFVRQVHYENFHGNTGYYFCFREKTEQEKAEENLTDVQMALVELYEMLLG